MDGDTGACRLVIKCRCGGRPGGGGGWGQTIPIGLLEPGVRPSCTALAWSCSVMLPGVANAARNLQNHLNICLPYRQA